VGSGCNIARDSFGWEEVKKQLQCCMRRSCHVLFCVKLEKLLLEDPCIELVKMGYFKDSVPGLTLSFVILRDLRWFQH